MLYSKGVAFLFIIFGIVCVGSLGIIRTNWVNKFSLHYLKEN